METKITAPDPHCIGWVKAHASLWGNVKWHELDEPMELSNRVPVRLRYRENEIVLDRELTFKAAIAGTHVAVRFYFENETSHRYIEVYMDGVHGLNNGETAKVKMT
jgi:hypothetical protein